MGHMKTERTSKSTIGNTETGQGWQERFQGPETVRFRDGDYALFMKQPGSKMDISPLVDSSVDRGGGMLGSDGALDEVVVVTESGSVYYLRGGKLANIGTKEVTDQYAASEAIRSDDIRSRLGDLTVGEPVYLADRRTSPVLGVYYRHQRRTYPTGKPKSDSLANPFACGQELLKADEERRRAMGNQLGNQALR